MKDQINTIRAAVDLCLLVNPEKAEQALAALAQIEAAVGEQDPVAWRANTKYGWVHSLAENRHLYEVVADWEPLYTVAPVAQQYEAGDVASASAQGFRDGVASVAQQPQEPNWRHPKIQGLIGADARNRIVIDLIWQILKDPNGNFSATDMEYWDAIHDAVQEAITKAQQPQADEATSAGLEASISILSQLVDEQRQLLAEVDAVFGVDAHGIVLEDGDSALIDRVRAHLAATSEAKQPQAEAVTQGWGEHEIAQAAMEAEIPDSKLESLLLALPQRVTQPQAEEVPLTHVLVPVDEPTDEMVDAACAAVDGLCRVDFVRAYVAAFSHLKAGYRDESYWCGWNAAIKFQQAEAVPQWVDPYEKTPEDGQECLVYSRQHWEKAPSVKMDTWQEQHEAPLSFSSATIPIGVGWDAHNFEDVIAWMPLPAAPQPMGGE